MKICGQYVQMIVAKG